LHDGNKPAKPSQSTLVRETGPENIGQINKLDGKYWADGSKIARRSSRAMADPIESKGDSRIAVEVIQAVRRMEAGGYAESSVV
jgi:hypothetical protein